MARETATLDFIAAHRTLYIVHPQRWLVPGVFAMVTSLSLHPLLQNRDRSVVGSADDRRSAVSIVMLGGVFPKAVAYLGIVVGVLGIASEVLRPVIGGAYGVYYLLMVAWTAAVG